MSPRVSLSRWLAGVSEEAASDAGDEADDVEDDEETEPELFVDPFLSQLNAQNLRPSEYALKLIEARADELV